MNALRFEVNAEEKLFDLSEELTGKTYCPSRTVCFILERPKMREIIAADFRDRIVHHVLVERLESIYEPIFIYDSYACRKDKGIHRAVAKVKSFISKGSDNGRRKLYYLHMDIKNFFMTIDKNILYSMLQKKVKDNDLLY
ncbi:retron-type reverse transcriptase, partial [Candidatus Magnetobacterium bavaricum]